MLVGRQSIAFVRYLGGLAEMFSKATYWTFVAPFRGKGVRWGAAIRQMVVVGFQAVPIVCLISAFIGIIIALQGAYELRKFGALNYVVDMVAITVTRELAPLLTAIIVIGRSGSAFAAEIGTMEVGEEVAGHRRAARVARFYPRAGVAGRADSGQRCDWAQRGGSYRGQFRAAVRVRRA